MSPSAAQKDRRCQQARDASLLGIDDDEAQVHRRSCPRCQAAAAEMDHIRAAFDAASRQGLDDLQRARMQSRLVEKLGQDRKAAPRPSFRSGIRRRITWAAAAVVLLALGLVLVRQLGRSDEPAVVASLTSRLVPYLLTGPSLAGSAADRGLGQDHSVLAVPPGGRLRAALLVSSASREGGWSRELAGRITLVGPARVRVISSTSLTGINRQGEREVRLQLDEGLMLTQITPGKVKVVRVSTGEVDVTVVGTLFSVEARQDRPAQVAVSRGAVDVRVAGGAPARVTAGQRWTRRGSTGELGQLDPSRGRLLTEHDQGNMPSPPGKSGILVLSGVPARVGVRLGRDDLGHTPLAALLPAEPTTISLRAEGHHPTQITVQINKGQVTRLGFTLNRLDPPPGPRQPDPQPPAAPAVTPADARVQSPRPGSPGNPVRRAAPSRATLPKPRSVPPDAGPAVPAPAMAPDAGGRPLNAEDLYRRAEQALLSGARGRARSLLLQITRRFLADALTPTAQFELARLAHAARQYNEARRHLGRVMNNPGAKTHHDPASFLLCRLMVQQRHNVKARRCLERFRRRFPASPHDQEALYVLGRLVLNIQGCKAATPGLRDYLRRYPRGAFAREVTRLLASCTR